MLLENKDAGHRFELHGSHREWKTGKTWKMGRHFPVREFCQDWKSRRILLKKLENQKKKLCWKIEINTGKVREICLPVIVKTLQIWYNTLNKKKEL